MTFSQALDSVKQGKKAARLGWNGVTTVISNEIPTMFIFLVPGSEFKVNRPPLLGIYPEGTDITYSAHIDMKTKTGEIVPWLASQTDLLSDDWVVISA